MYLINEMMNLEYGNRPLESQDLELMCVNVHSAVPKCVWV